MGRKEKLLKRFLLKPKDFTWDELVKILNDLGYSEKTKGKTGGSRRKFIHNEKAAPIMLHKPHPGKILKRYQMDLVIEHLHKEDLI